MAPAVNQLMCIGRENKGLSVKQAAKLLKVPSFILRRLEYGYWRVSKKLLTRAGELYGIEEELSLATQAYVATLPEKSKQKSARRDLSLLQMLGSIAGLLLSVALIIISVFGFKAANYSNPDLYGDNFNALYRYVDNSEDEYVSYEGEYGTVEYTKGLAMLVSKALLNRTYKFYDETEVTFITTAENYPCDNVTLDLELDGFTYSCTASFDENGNLKKLQCVDDVLQEVEDSKVLVQLEAIIKDIYPKAISDFNAFYDNIGLGCSYKEVLIEEYSAIKAVTTVYVWSAAGLYFVPIAAICLGVLSVIFTAKYIEKLRAKKFVISGQIPSADTQTVTDDIQTPLSQNIQTPLPEAEAAVADDGALLDEPAVIKSRFRVLWEHITPVLHENVLRAVGLIMLALGSLVPYLTFIKFFGGLSESQTNFITQSIPYLKPCISVATVLLFFTRIDILTYRKSYKNQLLQYGIIGTVFYYEIALTLLLTGLVNYQPIMFALSSVLPGNIFLGMFAYTLTALFLFYTPKWVKTKKATVLWRCLSILPLSYVLFGTFVIPYLNLTPLITGLFFTNSLVPSLSAVGYIFVRFIFNKVQSKTLPLKETGALRSKGIMLIKNLSACLVICLVILLSYLFSLSEATIVLAGGQSAIALIALPFIALYQPRLEPRSKVQDAVFGILYGIAFTISYILILSTPLSLSILKTLKDFILK
ncbi:MAG: hypothetical protein ACI4MQ_04115 [Candidatus Coproplasma sp.]